MAERDANIASLERYVPRIATDWDVDAPGKLFQELDASLCFVDISGFTNLSEKLSRRGRIGAEELTAVLNYVFGKMLELAYAQGGSLLKFGGDALLLLYTGDGHAERAASAAVEMRAALRSAEDYKTSVGKLRLKMSVGIHSGAIHLFRAGASHNELVIAGEGGTTLTVMEKTADPGEIVVSGGTKDRLPRAAVGAAKGPGWLLRWRKAHCIAPGPVMRDDRDAELLESWMPVALRDHLRDGRAEAEHRIATVGFVRFCGVDAAMEFEGPEWVAEAISSTMATIQEAANEEGITFLGTDINEDGAKAILVAGAPAALEEDEARMLRAARQITDAPTPLDTHVGVNRGHVFSGEVGTQFRATYTVMGDTVNLAARLMAAAHAGTVYATPVVLDQSGTLFAAEALPPFHVKGKDEPVHAYSVGDEIGQREVDERDALPFSGREAEIDVIRGLLSGAQEGRGAVLAVVGEAGMGKSRAVREAVDSASDMDAIWIRSEPYGAATPYRPLRDRVREMLEVESASNDEMAQALQTRLAEFAPDLVPMAPLIGTVAHIDLEDTPEVAEIEPRFRQERLNAVLVDMIGRIHSGPLLVVADDAHWMDEASVALLEAVSAATSERPWAVIALRRGDEGGFGTGDVERLEIGPLDEGAVEKLVIEATKATPLHPKDVEAIVARTEGNPLFVSEVLRIVAETGSTDSLPDSLGTLVTSSIDALPALTKRILRYASVLGRSFRASAVNEILAADDLELDAATREVLADFIEVSGEGRYRFRTAMVRDVAYDGLSFRRREELHRRAAKAIEHTTDGSPEDAADQLAMHYHLGNDHENTWHYALIAAERAARAFANSEASTQYERALAAGRRLPDVDDRALSAAWTELGDVREQAGRFDDALDAYRHASRLVDDPIEKAELLLKRAWVRERAASYPMALRESSAARAVTAELSEVQATEVRARVDAFQAVVRMRQGKPSEALERATSAKGAATKAGDQASLARAVNVLAWTKLIVGDPAAADLCSQAFDLYEEIGDIAGQNRMSINLGVLAYFDNRWDDAVRFYERCRDGAERIGNYVDVGYAASNLGEVLVNRRELDAAEECLTDAARVLRATGELSTATFAEVHLARVFIVRGELDEARDLLRSVIDESAELGFAANAGAAEYYLAECALEDWDQEAALAGIARAFEVAGEVAEEYSLLHARIEGLAFCRSGRVDDAVRVLASGISTAAERGLLYEEGLLHLALADVFRSTGTGDPDPSEKAGRTALDRLGVVM